MSKQRWMARTQVMAGLRLPDFISAPLFGFNNLSKDFEVLRAALWKACGDRDFTFAWLLIETGAGEGFLMNQGFFEIADWG